MDDEIVKDALSLSPCRPVALYGGLNYCGECYNRATSRMTFSEKLEDFYETFVQGRIGYLCGPPPESRGARSNKTAVGLRRPDGDQARRRRANFARRLARRLRHNGSR